MLRRCSPRQQLRLQEVLRQCQPRTWCSKQFTAASVVLAAEQGHLALDDDVHKYIPELPDYGRPVTLRQMLHQTSGFRDLFDLISLSGRNPAEIESPADILKLIMRQKRLNNVPGEEWIATPITFSLLR